MQPIHLNHILKVSLLLPLCFLLTTIQAQENKKTGNKEKASTDSISNNKTKKKNKIENQIVYTASDSIVLDMKGDAFLYGQGKVEYGKLNLTADFIHLNTDSNSVNAHGNIDKDGNYIGQPKLVDNGEEYDARNLRYNFVTKKGFIHHGIVQQGEGYIIGEKTKKVDEEYLCMKDGKYTTCDDHDCPHFYLNLTKAKVRQKKWVVTGPAYLVMLDVPLPLAIPFGYFPFTKDYSSGVIIPSYGDDIYRGFYLTNGGYYFAISDYMDMTLTGDIYTKGTWASNLNTNYVKRYKYRGVINANYREDVTGEKELKDVYQKTYNLAFTWKHTQDAKAHPYRTFSASVDFSSSGYDRANLATRANPTILSRNIKSSSVSYTYNFPETPFCISANILGTQKTEDSTITLRIPDLTFTMSRIYPFKQKNGFGKEKWYEKIYMSYTGQLGNSITTKENKLFESSLANDWNNGVDHSIPFGANFNILKYLSITPNATYHERWYLKQIRKYWDDTNPLNKDSTSNDTINRFYRVYDFNVGISASTKIYGFFTPNRRLFGDRIGKIRHVITPSISYNFKPDFSDPFWGSWTTYNRPTSSTDPSLKYISYSPFANMLYGTSSSGKSSSLSFTLNNNIEMKWKQHNDTTGEAKYKTVSLIDAFSVSGSYNFAVDSLNWSNFNANLRLKLAKNLTMNLSGTFDTYLYDENANYINTARWEVGQFPRLRGTSTAFSYSFGDQTFKKKEEEKKDDKQTAQQQKKDGDTDGYAQYHLPWNISFDYSMQYGYNKFIKEKREYNYKLTHNIGIRGNMTLTSRWSFNAATAYDFNSKQITYSSLGVTRNLHCWSMTANIVPLGPYKTYNFLVHVNSSLLSDLKYEKQSDYSTAPINWY